MFGSLADLANQFFANGNEPIYNVEMLKDVSIPALPLLITGKQILCCDYLNLINRLDETCLPAKNVSIRLMKKNFPKVIMNMLKMFGKQLDVRLSRAMYCSMSK